MLHSDGTVGFSASGQQDRAQPQSLGLLMGTIPTKGPPVTHTLLCSSPHGPPETTLRTMSHHVSPHWKRDRSQRVLEILTAMWAACKAQSQLPASAHLDHSYQLLFVLLLSFPCFPAHKGITVRCVTRNRAKRQGQPHVQADCRHTLYPSPGSEGSWGTSGGFGTHQQTA